MRKKVKGTLAAVAALGAAVGPFAGVAGAAPTAPEPSVAYVGGVFAGNGDVANIKVAYTCTSVDSPANHMFVAIKQGPGVSPDNASSETGNVQTFLSTNWKSDAGPNSLNCDGRQHIQSFVVKTQPGFTGKPLTNGQVLVQLCLYDNVTGFEGYEPIGGFAASYTMEQAFVSNGNNR